MYQLETKYPDETLFVRGINLNLCIFVPTRGQFCLCILDSFACAYLKTVCLCILSLEDSFACANLRSFVCAYLKTVLLAHT